MSEYSTSSLSKSASKFTKSDFEKLNIEIEDDENCIIREDTIHKDLEKFILSNCRENEIFRPSSVEGVDIQQRRFLRKLGNIISTVRNIGVGENFVSEFINTFLSDAYFDDGDRFICNPGTLKLYIGKETKAAYADRECSIKLEGREDIIWTLVENKKGDNPKNSEIQLAACMIAAMQNNDREGVEVDILGIVVLGKLFRFYRCVFNREYLDEINSDSNIILSTRLRIKRLAKAIAKKRPREVSRRALCPVELDISTPVGREEILRYLSYFKSYSKEILDELE